jgi:hypothetical protein
MRADRAETSPLQAPLSRLELKLIDEFVRARGYDHSLPDSRHPGAANSPRACGSPFDTDHRLEARDRP